MIISGIECNDNNADGTRTYINNTYFFRDPLFKAVEPEALVPFFALLPALRGDGGSGETETTDEAVDNLVDLRVGIADWPSSSSSPTFRVDRPFLAGRLLGGGETGKGAT
jgi:hypothetical protein